MYEIVKIVIDIAFVVVAAIVIISAIKKKKKKKLIRKGQEENPGLSFSSVIILLDFLARRYYNYAITMDRE